jgi:hypothetical protein
MFGRWAEDEERADVGHQSIMHLQLARTSQLNDSNLRSRIVTTPR